MSKIAWSKLEAPTLTEFEELAHAAYQRLPARFRTPVSYTHLTLPTTPYV